MPVLWFLVDFGYRNNEITATVLNDFVLEYITLSCIEGIAVDTINNVRCFWFRDSTELYTSAGGSNKHLTVTKGFSSNSDEYYRVQASYVGEGL